MPGLVGIVGSGSPKDNTAAVSKMLNSMLHEPSYTSGTYVNEQLGLYLGWANRPDPSPTACRSGTKRTTSA